MLAWPAKGKVWDDMYPDKMPVGWWSEKGYSREEINAMDDVTGIFQYLDCMAKKNIMNLENLGKSSIVKCPYFITMNHVLILSI